MYHGRTPINQIDNSQRRYYLLFHYYLQPPWTLIVLLAIVAVLPVLPVLAIVAVMAVVKPVSRLILRLPLDERDTIKQWEEDSVDPGVIPSEGVEPSQRLAIFGPVRLHLLWKSGIGLSGDGHPAGEDCQSYTVRSRDAKLFGFPTYCYRLGSIRSGTEASGRGSA